MSNNGPIEYISQKAQDKWLIEHVLGGNIKQDGYFLDLASADGVELSNTYLLETYLGWDGICIEADKTNYALLSENRKCHTINDCIDSKVHNISFRNDIHMGNGIIDDDTDNNYATRGTEIENAIKEGYVDEMVTRTLDNVLTELNAPSVIDYFSFDVEGSETRILRDFPFDKWTFLAITIERPTPELNELLFDNDYIFVRNSESMGRIRNKLLNQSFIQAHDSFYVHKSIPNLDKIPKDKFKQVPKK